MNDGPSILPGHEIDSGARAVSIIIPSFNSSRTLKLTLSSILRQDQAIIEETIVVDSSDDGMIADIKSEFGPKGIRFITAGIKVMPAIQRNIGARLSRGKLLLFLDADVILEENYVAKILGYYDEGYMAGFGSVVLPEFQKKRFLPVAQYYLQLSEYMPRGPIREKAFFLGCSNFCDRRLFDASGGYPEIRASEDVLYGLNVSKLKSIWFFPEARVSHVFRDRWKGFLGNQKLLGKYVAKYRKRESNMSILRPSLALLLFPLFFTYKISRILQRIISAGPMNVFKLIYVFPVFLVGVISWSAGFVTGIREPPSESAFPDGSRSSPPGNDPALPTLQGSLREKSSANGARESQ